MSTDAFTLTLHMVSSLDGIIAKEDDSISWFDTKDNYDKGTTPTEQEVKDFLKNIDCYVMGSRTYEHALHLSKSYGWAYGDKPTVVLTNRKLPVERDSVSFYAGGPLSLVEEELKSKYNNVWLVGGANVAAQFLRLKLVDEIRLSVLPIILGGGKPFFSNLGLEQPLHLKNITAYKSGMTELHYEVRHSLFEE